MEKMLVAPRTMDRIFFALLRYSIAEGGDLFSKVAIVTYISSYPYGQYVTATNTAQPVYYGSLAYPHNESSFFTSSQFTVGEL